MTLTDLLPTIQLLPRADKFRLIQLLAADVAREEGNAIAFADKAIPLWSAYDAFDGAATLLNLLEQDKDAP